MGCDLLYTVGGVPKAKAVIKSRDDVQRLIAGEPVDADWYRAIGDDWEFIERRPLKFNFQKKAE